MVQLRPYQLRAVDFCTSRRRAFVIAPAGSGKTLIASGSASAIAQPFWTIAWIANTREQCEQAHAAIAKMEWPAGVSFNVHCAAAQQDVSGYDLVIVDEAHHLPAATWWASVSQSNGIVWGFSATPWSEDQARNKLLTEFFGGSVNFITISRKEVELHGSITKGYVFIHNLDFPSMYEIEVEEKVKETVDFRERRFCPIPHDQEEARKAWRQEQEIYAKAQFTAEVLRNNEQRNDKIVELANMETASTLILVSTIKHGEMLSARIPGSRMVFAKMGKKKRKEAIEGFRDGSLRVMLATSLADEGMDVPRAAVLILAVGQRAKGKLEQRAGRVMRPHESKEYGIIHDFCDLGCKTAYSQFKARLRTYKKLGYTFIDEN